MVLLHVKLHSHDIALRVRLSAAGNELAGHADGPAGGNQGEGRKW